MTEDKEENIAIDNCEISISTNVATEQVENWVYNTLRVPKGLIVADEDKKEAMEKLVKFTENGLITFDEEHHLVLNLDKAFVFKNRFKGTDLTKISRIKNDVEKTFAVISVVTGVSATELKNLDAFQLGVLNNITPFYI